MSLTALPYLVVLAGMAILAVMIMVMAWPGNRPAAPPPAPPAVEVGTAQKGWLQKP